MRRMSDTFRLSGIAAPQLAGARQRNRSKKIDLPVNRNFSTTALCNAVMDNRDIIERTALEPIKLYRQLGPRRRLHPARVSGHRAASGQPRKPANSGPESGSSGCGDGARHCV